jgi:HD superfamily phosphohydrolase YqeK
MEVVSKYVVNHEFNMDNSVIMRAITQVPF